jgi:CubicO group peptidase (beta-lactamase class C family)
MHINPKSPLTLLSLFLVLGSLLRADPIDDVVAAQMAKRHIPGVSIAIIQGGEIVKAKGYGVSDLATGRPVAAFGALVLVEEGKLSLDADINTLLRSWKLPENEFTKDSKVTLRRLLSHQAGTTVHGFPGYAVEEPLPTLVQVLDGKAPANTEPIRVDIAPGSKLRYSGGGYVIMQQMVIDVTGGSYPDYMSEHVLKPLGMAASTYEQPLSAPRALLAAAGYYPGEKMVPGRWHLYPEMTAAGLWTTPTDLARFAMALQKSLAGQKSPVLSPEMVYEMLKSQKNEAGLGLFLSGKGKSRRFEHGGRNEGFDTMLTAYFETGQGAVVMINTNENTGAVGKIIEAIATVYAWPDFPRSKPAVPIADKEPQVTAQVKEIFEEAQKGSFKRELYSKELADIFAVQLAPDGPALGALKSFGSLKSVAFTGRTEENGLRQYTYLFTYENETLVVTCAYAPDGKIVGLNFRPE